MQEGGFSTMSLTPSLGLSTDGNESETIVASSEQEMLAGTGWSLLPSRRMKKSINTTKTLLGILTVSATLCVGTQIQAQTNEPAALVKLRAEAEKGDAQSQCELGRTLIVGNMGVAKDAAGAVNWFRKAADQNFAPAQTKLGVCYMNGYGVGQNEVEAIKLFCKAAEQNFAEAECFLGHCCSMGRGVPQDDTEAVKWYRRAADQNNAEAQFSLGVCLTKSAKTFSEGFKWYMVAAAQGYPAAKKKVDEDSPNLNADTYDAVKDAVKQFTPKTSITSDESAALKVEAQAFVKKAEDYAVQLAIEAKARAERLAKEEQEKKAAQAKAEAQAKIDAQRHQDALAQQAALDKKYGGSSDSGSAGNHSHKSARQLIRDRAEALYGRDADVTIDSGYAGGAYTVTVSQNFHTYTYAVKVDEAAQEITMWKLTAND